MRTVELSAIAYLTECTLATVAMLECRTKPPKHELLRQKSIAEFGLNHLRGLKYTAEDAKYDRMGRVSEKLK